ncbi:MAG: hypothetical protein GY854_03310 [Deltaproteobacteria bacterium]|nr:hypothetical protein [Deltaproteobacteria bacterium]
MKNSPSPLANLIEALPTDEKAIITALLQRLCSGRETYGPWRVDDGRDYRQEALAEVLDALHYCAAELVRLSRFKNDAGPRRPRVYVCHPYSNDPENNVAQVTLICRALVANNALPLAPHLFIPQFVDEETDREKALELCCDLLGMCDEVRVYGGNITDGMRREIGHAMQRGIPVRFVDEVEA